MICPANWRQSGEELPSSSNFDPNGRLAGGGDRGGSDASACERRPSPRLDPTRLTQDGGYEDALESAVPNPIAVPADSRPPGHLHGRDRRPPNGSMLTHRNLLSMGMQTGRVTGADHSSVFLNSGPLFHIGNFQFERSGVRARRHQHLRPKGRAGRVLQIIAEERCDLGVPDAAHHHEDQGAQRARRRRSLVAATRPVHPACGVISCRGHHPLGDPNRAASDRRRSQACPFLNAYGGRGLVTPVVQYPGPGTRRRPQWGRECRRASRRDRRPRRHRPRWATGTVRR